MNASELKELAYAIDELRKNNPKAFKAIKTLVDIMKNNNQ